MSAVYNDNDQFSAAWLEGLISSGKIPKGVVDRRSIAELGSADVAGSGHRHFFAGIGGWAYALRLAGVPDDADVWTGSCPCQPLSDAGQRRGFLDPRHLWPTWLALIEQCRPPIIFGEQVASKLGLTWLDLVFADLERCGYSVGAADLCAASIGAPHQRQRLFFVAYTNSESGRLLVRSWRSRPTQAEAERSGQAIGLANPDGGRRNRRSRDVPSRREQPDAARRSPAHGVADASCERLEIDGEQQARGQLASAQRGGEAGWSRCAWIPCSDGVSRPVEPGTHPLAHGVPGRVGLLRGYGNAIVPQVAAIFVRSVLDAMDNL